MTVLARLGGSRERTNDRYGGGSALQTNGCVGPQLPGEMSHLQTM